MIRTAERRVPAAFLLSPSVFLASALTLLAITACAYIPRPVAGIPAAPPWTALPLRNWLAEDRGEPEAVAACFSAECPQRLAVGVFRLDGPQARASEAVLADPERLVRHLRQPAEEASGGRGAAKARQPVRTIASARALSAGGYEGFALTLGRADGTRRPAHAAALGMRNGDALRIVLVVGEDPAAVEATARQVAIASRS